MPAAPGLSVDPLGVFPASRTPVAALVARALEAAGDAQAAAILRAQAAWLVTGEESARHEAARLVQEITDPRRLDRWRAQLHLSGVFQTNLTVLTDLADPRDPHDHVFIYDDDIVSLEDGGQFDREVHANAWEANTDGADALIAHLDSAARDRVCTLRMIVFEGTARFERVLRDRGAQHLVTHLELRLQRARDEAALAPRFPALLGLCCESMDVATLLRVPMTSLRSLVVRGGELGALTSVLERAPSLRHLGVHFARWDDASLASLLADPRVAALTSLELHDVHGTASFPFDALAATHPSWSRLVFVGVPGHGVMPEVRTRFAAHPQVTFIGHDRREVIALDFETTGWAASAR